MKRALIISLTFFLSLLSISLNAQNDKRLKGLDDELNSILKATKAAGFAVAIVEKDKVVYARGFGYRDYENKLPADANTLFAIGSSSKSFTSALMGQLREEGELTFDDRPQQYIKELRFFNDELNNGVTIQDMMCHRTGLPRHDVSWYFFPTEDRDSLVARIEYQEPFAGLRERWYYNNFMFLCQGVIAERITGKSWEDNIRERFFGPLDMKRSNLTISELEASDNFAYGYELEEDSIIIRSDYYHIRAMSPAGSINSSVNEMANWLKIWINEGKYGEEQILPEQFVREAMTSQMVIGGGLPDNEFPDIFLNNYGYGWFIRSYRGHYRVEHGGNINGFSANIAFYPSDSLGIVVLANQNGSGVPGMVRNTIADRMLETERTDWVQRFIDRQNEREEDEDNEQPAARVTGTDPSHVLMDYTGNYSHAGYGDFDITLENDSLFAHIPYVPVYLSHHHYDVFTPYEVTDDGVDTTDAVPIRFNFLTNEAGDISGVMIQLEATIDHLEFERTPNTIDVDTTTLESYVGEYELGGVTIEINIRQGSVLYLYVPGQPEYELLATEKHKFIFRAIEGFKVEFVESEDGSINELMLYQPNGTFTATRRQE